MGLIIEDMRAWWEAGCFATIVDLVGFQVMHVCAGLVTCKASALTSYLSSGAPGMVVHVKNIFPYLNKD